MQQKKAIDWWQILERILKVLSILTIVFILTRLVISFLGRFPSTAYVAEFFPGLPEWCNDLMIPILTAASVGYLTNWAAIEMLFKPYSINTTPRWYRLTLGHVWQQGLVPRNKSEIGKILGEEIPKKLLDPEEITRELCEMADDFLKNRELLDSTRKKLNRFLRRHGDRIADFLLPHLSEALKIAVKDNLTTDNIRLLWREVVAQWMANENNRNKLAGVIVGELQRRCPEITGLIRKNATDITRQYVRENSSFLKYIKGEKFIAGWVHRFNWQKIEDQIRDRLAEESTVTAISDELSILSVGIGNWLETADADIHLQGFVEENRKKLDAYLREYISRELTEITNHLFASEALWNVVEDQVLSAIREYVNEYLHREGKDAIIDKLDLSRRIEESVAGQDVRQFHEMINTAAAKHLGHIQVLGFFLGGIAGVLLVLSAS